MQSKQDMHTRKAEQRAAALRDNLMKRKAQKKAKTAMAASTEENGQSCDHTDKNKNNENKKED